MLSKAPIREQAIPIKAILVGLPKSIEEKLTARSAPPHLELIGCARGTIENIVQLLDSDKTNVVLIDASQTWAAGLARALRNHNRELKLLILDDPARMTGYMIYDFDRMVENAGEQEVIGAIEAAAAGRAFLT
ncbi:MAG: hypothetical protein ACRENP_05015 [Longimicrobiales bacterium]